MQLNKIIKEGEQSNRQQRLNNSIDAVRQGADHEWRYICFHYFGISFIFCKVLILISCNNS